MFMREERLCPHNCPQSPEICPEILLNSARRIYEKTRQKTLQSLRLQGFVLVETTELESVTPCVGRISTDFQEVNRLAECCNSAGLSPVHLADVVEDFRHS